MKLSKAIENAGVDYNTNEHTNMDLFRAKFEDMRLSSLATLEELLQLFIKNKRLAIKESWLIEVIETDLIKAINILNKI